MQGEMGSGLTFYTMKPLLSYRNINSLIIKKIFQLR